MRLLITALRKQYIKLVIISDIKTEYYLGKWLFGISKSAENLHEVGNEKLQLHKSEGPVVVSNCFPGLGIM